MKDTEMDKRPDLDFFSNRSLPPREMSSLEKSHRDEALDEALRCTFPASDPIALNFSSPKAGIRRIADRLVNAFK